MSKSSIPTQEDFDRAKAEMAYRDRHWDDISAAARKKLSGVFDLNEFAMSPNDCEFAAMLLLRTDEDVKQARASAAEAKARQILIDAIRPFVLSVRKSKSVSILTATKMLLPTSKVATLTG